MHRSRRGAGVRRGMALAGALLAGVPLAAADLDLFDWMGPAPVVIAGEVVRSSGKFVEVRIDEVVRGGLEVDGRLLVHLRAANRRLGPFTRPLKLPEGESFLLLLEPSSRTPRGADLPIFDLVRGIHGARPLPPEGAEASVGAARSLARIQDYKDETRTWEEMRRLLEDTNPVLVLTALRHHHKFRRGSPAYVPLLRPLLDHPRADVREHAARLIGQILGRNGGWNDAEAEPLYAELAARARRDPAVAVRVAATEALDRMGGEDSEELLRQIATGDPDQLVRFTAEKLLYERELRREPPGDRR